MIVKEHGCGGVVEPQPYTIPHVLQKSLPLVS
jgi:hypothetical protein